MWFGLLLSALVALLVFDYVMSGYGRVHSEADVRRELDRWRIGSDAGGWFGGR